MTRVLVIDGNEAATRARHVSVGGTSSGEGYAATLERLKPDVQTDIVRPADEDPKLPEGVALRDYQGVVITGSALSIIPLVALFLTMQRYWRTDLSSGAVKS